MSSAIHKLSIIIPAYNEETTIVKIRQKVCEINLPDAIQKEIIVVNDASTDDTELLVKKFSETNHGHCITLHAHKKNLGKGGAIHSALPKCTGDYVLIQDADLEYDPEDYNKMLEPVLKGNADAVLGSRFKGDTPHRVLYFWHYVGNKLLTLFTNLVTDLNLSDMETGYKLVNLQFIRKLNLKEKKFGFEPEFMIKLARIPNVRIYEVGISYYGRTYAEGKKIGWKDGISAIACIVKYGLFKMK